MSEVTERLAEKIHTARRMLRSMAHPADTQKKLSEGTVRELHDVDNQLARMLQVIQEELENDPPVERQPDLKHRNHRHSTEEVEEHHEAYGTIAQSVITGHMRLAGSALEASQRFIEVRLYRARRTINRHLHTENFWHDKPVPLVSFRMSLSQWLEFITHNGGVEVPCTLVSQQGVRFEEIPLEALTPLEQIAKDAREAVKPPDDRAYQAVITKLREKVESSKLPRYVVTELTKLLDELAAMPDAPIKKAKWAIERLAEDAGKVVEQAKVEIAVAFDYTRLREQILLEASQAPQSEPLIAHTLKGD